MNKFFTAIFIFLITVSCSTNILNEDMGAVLEKAESRADAGGKKVLEASQAMIADKEIVVGACWDYINAVFNRAGFPDGFRTTVYKSKFHGPYLNLKDETLKPGDWLYFVNHSFRESEHSAIFVDWADKDKKIAWMVSYVGGNKKQPAFYKKYSVANIYNIVRAKE
jgi:hypothetical protein